jgi:hypothetical protein
MFDSSEFSEILGWDHPFISAMRQAGDPILGSDDASSYELKKVCWGGGRQTPP